MKFPKWRSILYCLLAVLVFITIPTVSYVLAQTFNSVQIANANVNSTTPTPTPGWIATTWASSGLNVISEVEPAQGVVNNIAFSTTPTINVSQGGIIEFKCTTAGASVSPTFTGLTPGIQFDFIFVQNGTTACTLTYPANVHGGQVVGTTLSGVNTQSFVVSANGTDAYSEGAGSTNLTGGTP